jgi:hypothetical protein
VIRVTAHHITENDSERRRLGTLLATLGDEELQRRLANGLTVADVLLHLAFWDDYADALLARWQEAGFAPSRSDFEAINSGLRRLAEAVPARLAPELARAAAETVDARVASVPEDLARAIDRGGHERILRRSEHRRLHLDQLERALGANGA